MSDGKIDIPSGTVFRRKIDIPSGTVFSFHEKIDIPSGTVFRRKIDIPTGTVFRRKIEMFFHLYTRSQLPVIQYITNMFSFLKNGDIHNTIRTLTGFTGLSPADSDKIKYSLLNHSTAMRRNVMEGLAVFTNIRQLEAEIETRDINSITSGRQPSVAASIAAGRATLSTFTPGDLHRDNAVLVLIMAKELAFLNRTIQMISLIASRYQQEQEDASWGCSDIQAGDELGESMIDNDDDDDEYDNGYDEEAMTPRCGLRRAGSHDSPQNATHTSNKNQLVSTFLVASGQLQQKFINLCKLAGTNIVLVNAMTTMDRPRSEANFEKQRRAENLVLSDIYLEFEKYDAEHRSPVVWAFLELRDISVSAWRIMSMLAFCNLIRLAEGTDFTINSPEDAIFSQGRDYCMPRQEAATMDWSAAAAGAADADADADAEADADAVEQRQTQML